MPIRDKTLKKHSEKYTILVDGTQTLDDALERFLESDYPENDAWLVVSQPDEQYQVIPLPELKGMSREMEPDSLTQPLSTLPIPPASRVVPKDTPESGGKIIDWVASNPGSTLVVIDDQGFVGLFTNPNRDGRAEDIVKLPFRSPCFCGYKGAYHKNTCPKCGRVYQ